MAPYYFIAASVAVLAGLGTLMVLSASSVLAMYSGLDPYYYVTRQVLFLGVGLVFAVVFSRINADFIRRLGWPAWMLAVALLVLVLTPLGVSGGGNLNWLALGPVQFQPSEFAKLALIVWCGTVFHMKRGRLHEPAQLAIPLIPLGGLILALVLAGRDLGTGLIIGLILVLIMWFIGTPLRVMVPLGTAVAALVALLVPLCRQWPALAGATAAAVVAVRAHSLPLRLGLLCGVLVGIAVALLVDHQSRRPAASERAPS